MKTTQPPFRPPEEVIAGVRLQATEIEPSRPIRESLEWRLAASYWALEGAAAFVSGEVPYLVNNSGRLSENAAVLLFASLTATPPPENERIDVLELGAGTGLFARYLLDAFRAVCEQEGRDFYDRLTLVVSDRSQKALSDWRRTGLFADHESHVVTVAGDAARPTDIWTGATPQRQRPRAIFCNYLLDVLPAAIVRRTDHGSVEELWVRTHLAASSEQLRQYTPLSLDEVRGRVARAELDPDALSSLGSIWPLLDLETDYRPATPQLAAMADALDLQGRAVLNHGAFACVDDGLSLLAPDGFLLINDYGTGGTAAAVGSTPPAVQRFGRSVAIGLDFTLLERHLTARGITCLTPPGDAERAIHSRLVSMRAAPAEGVAFANRFGLEADRHQQEPLIDARSHAAGGRQREALDAFRVALERNRGDWQVMGEAAEYVGLELRDHAAGIELARAAVARNPWFSPWVWNVLGDCLFCANRHDEAHEAYLRAEQIDGGDPRTNLNLAYTLAERGQPGEALHRLASGLLRDARGIYRTRLLEQQAQILAALTNRTAADADRALKRLQRFT